MVCEGVDLTHLVQWRAVSTVLNIRFPIKGKEFLERLCN